jgi:2'-hydroxyisoflavone reductase
VFTWREQVEAIAAAVAPDGTTLTWVEPSAVEAAGVEPGAFPLWSGDDPDVWVMAADPARAFASGLTPRPLADTIRDTLAWTRTVTMPEGTGVTPEQERRLLG